MKLSLKKLNFRKFTHSLSEAIHNLTFQQIAWIILFIIVAWTIIGIELYFTIPLFILLLLMFATSVGDNYYFAIFYSIQEFAFIFFCMWAMTKLYEIRSIPKILIYPVLIVTLIIFTPINLVFATMLIDVLKAF